METRVYIDFETHSVSDIQKEGAWAYARHPSTDLMCIAFALDDGPIEVLKCATDYERLRPLATNSNFIFVAHNAFFEQAVWKCVLERLYKLPPVPIYRWRCTAAKASACGLPKKLEKVANALELDVKKDIEGAKVMRKLCRPYYDELGGLFWYEATKEEWETLYKYCAQDVEVERLVDEFLPDLPAIEQKVWEFDQLINFRGVGVDTKLMTNAIAMFEEFKKRKTKELVALTDGFLDGVSKINRVRIWMAKEGVNVPDLTKDTVFSHYHNPKTPEKVKKVLALRMQLAKTSVAKYIAMRDATMLEPRFRGGMVYHAAITGRWGGRAIQLQNLPSSGIKNTDECAEVISAGDYDDFDMLYGPNLAIPLVSCIRSALVPKKGYRFLVADYKTIETRVLFWMAKETAGLNALRKGADIYVDMAKYLLNKSEVTKAERQLGKQIILGCGYQMGHKRFRAECERKGIILTEDEAQLAVAAYRNKYRSVVNAWYAMENMVRNEIGLLPEGSNFYHLKLPSGRSINYYKPKVVDSKVSYSTGDEDSGELVRTDTYGGKLVENWVQAVSRDLLAHAITNLELARYPVVFTVHDEIVSEVPEGFGSLDEMIGLMTTLPKWAKDLPIGAEGWEGYRYKK